MHFGFEKWKFGDVPVTEAPDWACDGVGSFHAANCCCGFGAAALRLEEVCILVPASTSVRQIRPNASRELGF